MSSYDSMVLGDSPVGFWPLNETSGTTAFDSTGANNGTYSGGFTLGAAGIGDGETSVLFDGVSGRASIPDVAALEIVGPLSLEAWITPTNYSPNVGPIISKAHGSFSLPDPYELALTHNFGQPRFAEANASTESSSLGTAAAPTTGWSYLVVTRDGANLVTHYLNGVANGVGSTFTNAGVDGADPVLIATRPIQNVFYVGLIAKAAIYNAVLSPTQIAAHFAAATPTKVFTPQRMPLGV